VWVQPDRFPEQIRTFFEAVLPRADRAQHGTGRGPRLGVRQRELSLLVSFLEPSLLDEGGRALEGRVRLGGKGGPWRPYTDEERGKEKSSVPAPSPPRRLESLRGGDILL